MATLLFTALGTLVGGPIGGVLGAMAGQQVDAAIIGGSNREGPRLKDLAVTTSSYGSALPRHFGRMRVGGTVIWATDLAEHQSSSGGGKGKPSVTSYSYTSSFAVALASRPIADIGRIWADGNLLRGAAGDIKVGGSLRIYNGHHDQLPDPLITAAEGAGNAPAFRGTAYVVFEDLQLADYGNRIPTLTFEIIADTRPLSLTSLFDGILDEVDANVALEGVAGFSSDGPLGDTLSQFQPLFPMNCDAGGERLTISRERLQTSPILLSEAAISSGKGDFGGKTGYSRKRAPTPENPPQVLRYYDVDLDYQPGSQRASGQTSGGQPKTIELPAAIAASDALRLISHTSRSANWARETVAWRCAQLDPTIAPGAVVTIPGQAGIWRVNDWEWRAGGVELSLARMAPSISSGNGVVSAGRANLAPDRTTAPTHIVAFELPWSGVGNSDTTALFAAVSSEGQGWSGAALFADNGDGALTPIGTSGRQRSTIGTAANSLAPASPMLFDRHSSLIVTLLSPDMVLTNASLAQLAAGANRALIGAEIIQFGRAIALGLGMWRLELLLRGRGGSEGAINDHIAGESFVLLDEAPVALDGTLIGASAGVKIAALGLGDSVAAESIIACRGISLRPLSPVQPRYRQIADGSISLGWTRRARGAWQWLDGVDAALQEQTETYQVCYGPPDAPVARWQVEQPTLNLTAATLTSLSSTMAQGAFYVQQQGTYALSKPLFLTQLI